MQMNLKLFTKYDLWFSGILSVLNIFEFIPYKLFLCNIMWLERNLSIVLMD